MKRIYYLLAITAVTAFSACNPLDKTYKQLGDLPAPAAPAASVTITLSAADYGSLPKSNSAQKSFYFKTVDSAKAGIPLILAAKYPTYGEKSSATVTFTLAPPAVKPVDSLISRISYTATNDDYISILGQNPKYIELTTAQAIKLLTNKYPDAVNNQIVLLTYIFYESGVVSTATTLTDTFIFLNGTWVKGYTISAAQFAYVGNKYGDFSSSDAPYINSYLNAILKADQVTTIKAKVGDVKYVSYKYYAGGLSQRIQPLTFDGTNWIANSLPQTLVFLKTNGTWVADNTVTYTLTADDYTFIKTTDVNVQTARDNVAQYGDFSIKTPLSPTTGWSDADINAVLILILAHDYPNAVADQKFIITYVAYNGATIHVTKTFVYNGTTFVLQQ